MSFLGALREPMLLLLSPRILSSRAHRATHLLVDGRFLCMPSLKLLRPRKRCWRATETPYGPADLHSTLLHCGRIVLSLSTSVQGS